MKWEIFSLNGKQGFGEAGGYHTIYPLDVGCQKYFCCFLCVLVDLTTVDKLAVFNIDFRCFSNQKVLFLAINDAMASSPQGGAAIESYMRVLKGRPRLHISV